MPDRLGDVVDLVRQEDHSAWLNVDDWRIGALMALFALVVFFWVVRKIRRVFRRRRKPTIHPLLQKYGHQDVQEDKAVAVKRRAEAANIIATSSTTVIAGYDIVQQVEAIHVDGFRRPEDAMEGLKSVASMKGANGVTNVHHERQLTGTCSACGDAVILQKQAANIAPLSDTPRVTTET